MGMEGNNGNSIRDAKGEAQTLVLIQISSTIYCATMGKSPHLSGLRCFIYKMMALA